MKRPLRLRYLLSNLPTAEAAAAESEATVGVRAPATICEAPAVPAATRQYRALVLKDLQQIVISPL
ncbi:MAG: hypothetical protein WCC17_11730 [Candidatus Nitrosopolaris sp.]